MFSRTESVIVTPPGVAYTAGSITFPLFLPVSDFTSKHMEQVAGDIRMELVFSEKGVPRGRGKV